MSGPSSPRPATVAEFDAFAGDYDAALNEGLSAVGERKEYFAQERVRWLRRRLAERGIEHVARVLDFGCGVGASTPFFLDELGAEAVVGVDVSEGLLDVARRRFAGDARVAFRQIGPYAPRGEFDLAFVNGVFHHIAVAERARALRYVHDALRPGGVFAFWENNPWNPGTRYVMSRIPFDRDAVTIAPPEGRRLLRAAGFEVARADFRFVFPRALAWLRPLETPLARLPIGGQYLLLGLKR